MFSKLLSTAVRRNLIQPVVARSLPQCFSTAAATVEPLEEDSGGVTMKGVKISGRPLYLDMQATSPVDPRVLDAMLPYYLSRYGNPHSRTHLYGWESENAVESARAQVAALIKTSPKEIIFRVDLIRNDVVLHVLKRRRLVDVDVCHVDKIRFPRRINFRRK